MEKKLTTEVCLGWFIKNSLCKTSSCFYVCNNRHHLVILWTSCWTDFVEIANWNIIWWINAIHQAALMNRQLETINCFPIADIMFSRYVKTFSRNSSYLLMLKLLQLTTSFAMRCHRRCCGCHGWGRCSLSCRLQNKHAQRLIDIMYDWLTDRPTDSAELQERKHCHDRKNRK